jgi:hypothetical protein
MSALPPASLRKPAITQGTGLSPSASLFFVFHLFITASFMGREMNWDRYATKNASKKGNFR